MSRKLYSHLWQDDAVTALGIYLAPAASADHMAAALRAAAAAVAPAHRQALFIRSNKEIRVLSMLIFERTFVITRVLYWLAAGVAAIALVDAVTRGSWSAHASWRLCARSA